MTEMQQKLLEMFTYLINYLETNELTYYIVGGTLLGAVRHKGFIPWDDDIDIAMPRNDYEKFIKFYNNENKRFILETPYENKDFLYTFSKLYDTQTTLIERRRRNFKRGIFIDILPLDGAGMSYKESITLFKKINKMNAFFNARTCAIRKERKWYKNLAIILARIIPLFDDKKYSLKIDSVVSSLDYSDSLYVANFSGTYGKKEVVEKRLFGKPCVFEFETLKVKGPEFYNEYLTHLYGDWTKLPPPEKRGIQHDYLYIDLSRPFSNKKSNIQ